MHIIHIASEVAPLAKVGGLSDVVLGLARELKTAGHKVDVIIPKYDCIDADTVSMKCVLDQSVRSFFDGAWHENTMWKAFVDTDFAATMLESHHPNNFYNRGEIYGCPDDLDRFLYFCRAVLDWLVAQNRAPDIIHIHDWMLAGVALLMQQAPYKAHFASTRVVFSIHNLLYQGKCQAYDLEKIGLDGAWCKKHLQDAACLNLVKGAILFSDYVTTVSKSYAKEVLTKEFGVGLENVLQENCHKFSGIVNGIDYTYWNPKTDLYIASQYSNMNDEGIFVAKKENTKALREMLQLQQHNKKPLVVVVARLVEQKGVPFIKHALAVAHAKGMQMVVLGTTPDPAVRKDFEALSKHFKDDPDVRVVLKQHESLAHMLYAAADIFLVPSYFEPCGLTQLIALRYGAIPLIRKTGGLADTVFDIDTEQGNGFCFSGMSIEEFDSALDRALALFVDTKQWQKLVVRAMHSDCSWRASCLEYVEVYKKLLQTANKT